MSEFHRGHSNLIPVKFSLFVFANDMAVLADKDVDLQYNVRILEEELSNIIRRLVPAPEEKALTVFLIRSLLVQPFLSYIISIPWGLFLFLAVKALVSEEYITAGRNADL